MIFLFIILNEFTFIYGKFYLEFVAAKCGAVVLANHLALWSKRAWLNKFIVVQNHGKIMYQPKRFVFFLCIHLRGRSRGRNRFIWIWLFWVLRSQERIQKVLNIGTKKCCMLVIWFTQADSSHCRVESDWIALNWWAIEWMGLLNWIEFCMVLPKQYFHFIVTLAQHNVLFCAFFLYHELKSLNHGTHRAFIVVWTISQQKSLPFSIRIEFFGFCLCWCIERDSVKSSNMKIYKRLLNYKKDTHNVKMRLFLPRRKWKIIVKYRLSLWPGTTLRWISRASNPILFKHDEREWARDACHLLGKWILRQRPATSLRFGQEVCRISNGLFTIIHIYRWCTYVRCVECMLLLIITLISWRLLPFSASVSCEVVTS